MEGMVPELGVSTYLAQLSEAVMTAPERAPVIQMSILGGLGACAVLFMLLALFKRSAVSAVSFSFLALAGLVAAVAFGRLYFVPEGTQQLILALFACSHLLFVTATIRVARDNPLFGAVVLMVVAAQLAVGLMLAIDFLPGAELLRLGLAVSMGLTVFAVAVEFLRGDARSIAVAPGLLAVAATPVAMAVLASQREAGWLLVHAPMILLAAGALYAVVAAHIALLAGPPKARSAGMDAPAAQDPAPIVREVPPPAPSYAAVDPSRPAEALADDNASPTENPFVEIGDDDEMHAPAAVRRPEAQGAHAGYAAIPTPAVATPAPFYADETPREPVSAQWGRPGAPQSQDLPSTPMVATDEYVWDALASQEVRMGHDFANVFSVPDQTVASPDVLRDRVAPGSLTVFDDAFLGGAHPRTGRFDAQLKLLDGAFVRIEGRRQLDHDDLLVRIEARATVLSPATTASTHGTATTGSAWGRQDADGRSDVGESFAESADARRNDQSASVEAPAEKPLTAAPLVAARPGKGAAAEYDGAVGAVGRGEIEVHFQPIARLADGEIVGFDAIPHWHRPEDGEVVPPADFAAAIVKADEGAELLGLTLRHAADELADWVKEAPDAGQFITVSLPDLRIPKKAFAALLEGTAGARRLPKGALVLALGADELQRAGGKVAPLVKEARQAGLSIAVDRVDASALSFLKGMKVKTDLIRLDPQLSQGTTDTDKRAKNALRSVLAQARKLGAPVIAHGVVEESAADAFGDAGCVFGMGPLYGDAAPAPSQEDHGAEGAFDGAFDGSFDDRAASTGNYGAAQGSVFGGNDAKQHGVGVSELR